MLEKKLGAFCIPMQKVKILSGFYFNSFKVLNVGSENLEIVDILRRKKLSWTSKSGHDMKEENLDSDPDIAEEFRILCEQVCENDDELCEIYLEDADSITPDMLMNSLKSQVTYEDFTFPSFRKYLRF